MPHAYDAFVSYSHRDLRIAESLQSVLESYRLPSAKRLRVFRDLTDLRLAPELLPALRDKIRSCRFLILLATPAAAASPIVRSELDYFFAEGRPDRLLWVLARGEPQESISPLLGGRAGEMPLYLDLRNLVARRRYGARELGRAVLPLVAALLEVDLDELLRRDEQWRMAHRRRRVAGVITGVVVTCAIAVFAGARKDIMSYAEASVATMGEEQTITYGGVCRVCFAGGEPVLAMGANGGGVTVWDLSREDHRPRQLLRTGSVRGVAWDRLGSEVYVTAGPLLWRLSVTGDPAPVCFRAGFELKPLHQDSAPGRWLVGAPKGQVAVVDMRELLVVREWQTGLKNLDSIWLWDEGCILLHELTGVWWLLHINSGQLEELPLPRTTACPPLFDTRTHEAVFSELSEIGSTVVVAHVPDGQRRAEFTADPGYPPTALARRGDTVAVGLSNGWIRLFSSATGRLIDDARLSVPGQPQSIAFSADGKLLAVGYKDLGSSEGGVRVFHRPFRLFGNKLWRTTF